MPRNTSTRRLYRTRAKTACSSLNVYLAMIPGVAVGYLGDCEIRIRRQGHITDQHKAILAPSC